MEQLGSNFRRCDDSTEAIDHLQHPRQRFIVIGGGHGYAGKLSLLSCLGNEHPEPDQKGKGALPVVHHNHGSMTVENGDIK